jgi:hypothetical protein
MQRPYTAPGIGWILAIIVLILAVLCALGAIALSPFWLIALLALALLI